MTNNKLLVLSLGLFCIPTLPALISSNNVSATDSITMTIDNSTVELSSTATNSNGTFVKSSERTVSVSTTNGTGYNLKIQGTEDPNQNDNEYYKKLINSQDSNTSTNSLNSISSVTTEDQFKSLAGTAYNNMWGYLPSKLNSEDNTSFLPAPTTTGDTLDITTAANSTANTYTLSLGARVDSTQKLGTYTNTYVILATANPIPYSITYDDNVVANMPIDVNSGQAVSGLVSFSSNTPTRDGYTFLGWCTVSVSNPTSSTSCTSAGGTYYAKDSSETINAAKNYKLYAMWEQIYMQDFTNEMCQAQATDHPVTLMDKRDNNDYTVSYINGNCWMTQNLRFIEDTLSSATSNVASTYTDANPLTLTWYDLVGEEGSSEDGHCYAYDSSDATSGGNNYACVHFPSVSDLSATRSLNYTSGQLGAWYNYAGATAGTIAGASNTATATYDICPKGWRLPSKDDFSKLIDFSSLFSPLYGGDYLGGVHRRETAYGVWWSSDSYNGIWRYYMYYHEGNAVINYEASRAFGYYIRCVRNS